MITGKTFREVRDRTCRVPVTAEEQDQLLITFEVRFIRQLYPTLLPDKVYIADTPSLNIPGGMHCIIIDTRGGDVTVLDPQRGRRGKQFYTGATLKSWATLVDIVDLL
jgi:hypothetical protein